MEYKVDGDSPLVKLIAMVTDQEKYECIASIPGPHLEMRSGSLPKTRTDGAKLRRQLLKYFNLDEDRLESCRREIASGFEAEVMVAKLRTAIRDETSFDRYLSDFIKAVEHKLTGRGIKYNKGSEISTIFLEKDSRSVTVHYPNDLVSVGLIWEIFMDDTYQIDQQIQAVDKIYDLGANIGLASLYFHLRNPACELVCIEPYADNLRILRKNLEHNNVTARVVAAAVSNENGEAGFYFGDQSHALPSLNTVQANKVMVPTLRLDEIVTPGAYGLKIDIEGSEAFLVEFEDIIKNARFIVGELHYSKNEEKNNQVKQFYDIIKRNFQVASGRPSIYFIEDDIELCTCFQGINKNA